MSTSVRSPTNIAVIKYWGKTPNWTDEHIPTKSSVSFTVRGLYTDTQLESIKNGNGKIHLTLNGRIFDENTKEHSRVVEFLNKISVFYPMAKSYDYHITSVNNFPTAAGFASSASGFAALGRAINDEINLGLDEKELSVIARLGSGSAARSIPTKGGMVIWHRGVNNIKLDTPKPRHDSEEYIRVVFSSYAESLMTSKMLKELSVIYISVADKEKIVGSRAGMKQTIETNPVYWNWVNYEEYDLLPRFLDAMKEKEWATAFDIITRASNGLHAMMMYTTPPIIYLNDISNYIIQEVLTLREKFPIAYTFDAGPNPIIFTLKENTEKVVNALAPIVGPERIFPTSVGEGSQIKKTK